MERIAAAGVLDVVSLGPDQNFQEHFFHPERMDPGPGRAGGCAGALRRRPAPPVRRHPAGQPPIHALLLGHQRPGGPGRGAARAIHNAWCAVPVFWYSELDGRSTRSLEAAIAEHGALVAWCAARGVPVERNDQNQWGLRHASDTVQVAAAALAAGLTAAAGVKTIVVQMMLNNPPGISPAMDVAKMSAMEALVRQRVGPGVAVLRETRGGLFSMPPRSRPGPGAAGVGHSHRHAAAPRHPPRRRPHRGPPHHRTRRPDRLLPPGAPGDRRCPAGPPRPAGRPSGGGKARPPGGGGLLPAGGDRGALSRGGGGRPGALAGAVRRGYLDAPYLAGIPAARGAAVTVVDGGCDAVDPASGRVLSERERLAGLG